MWHSIALQIAKTLSQPFVIDKRQLILKTPNGSFYLISDHQYTYTVRIADKKNARNIEHMIQNQLAMVPTFFAPKPILDGSTADFYFVVYPLFQINPSQIEAQQWRDFGWNLALQHQQNNHQEMYGWDDDTLADDQLQPNRWSRNWSSFFAEQRIGWQLQLLQEKDQNRIHIQDVLQVIRQHLSHHHPQPSRLHGYLDASGNLYQTSRGFFTPDNACYYGDGELDLAWLKLTVPQQFDTIMEGYRQVIPETSGFDVRQSLYLLYPMLIKLHHHPEYRQQVTHQLETVLAI